MQGPVIVPEGAGHMFKNGTKPTVCEKVGDGSKHECFFEAVNHFLGLKMNSNGNLFREDFIQRLSSNQNKMLRCIVNLYDMNGEIF